MIIWKNKKETKRWNSKGSRKRGGDREREGKRRENE